MAKVQAAGRGQVSSRRGMWGPRGWALSVVVVLANDEGTTTDWFVFSLHKPGAFAAAGGSRRLGGQTRRGEGYLNALLLALPGRRPDWMAF